MREIILFQPLEKVEPNQPLEKVEPNLQPLEINLFNLWKRLSQTFEKLGG